MQIRWLNPIIFGSFSQWSMLVYAARSTYVLYFLKSSVAPDNQTYSSFSRLTDVFPRGSDNREFRANIEHERAVGKFGIEISPRNISNNQTSRKRSHCDNIIHQKFRAALETRDTRDPIHPIVKWIFWFFWSMYEERITQIQIMDYVGEFASQSSPVAVCQLYAMWMDARMWLWIIKNTLKLSVVQFHVYSIYNMYKRVPVHWTKVRRAEICGREWMSIYFEYPISINNWQLSASSLATSAEGRKTSKQRLTRVINVAWRMLLFTLCVIII